MNLRSRLLLGAALLPSLVIAFFLLRTSQFEAVTAGAQALDNILAILALVVLVSVPYAMILPWLATLPRLRRELQLEFPRPAPGEAVLAASAVAGGTLCLTIALTGLSHIDSFGLSLRPAVWTMISGLGCLGAALAVTYTWDSLREATHGSVSIAAFLAPPVLLATLQFWAQSSYLPGHLEASITLDPSVVFEYAGDTTERRGTATLTLTNEGATGTVVVISGYLLCFPSGAEEIEDARVGGPGCRTVVRPIAERAVVEAGSSFHHRWTFTWPEEAAYMQANPRIAYARADRLRLGPALDSPLECTSSATAEDVPVRIREAYPVLAPSRYRSLVSPEYILAYGKGRQGGRTYWITEASTPACDRSDELLEKWGVREMQSVSRQWIPLPGEPESPL